MSNIDNSTVTDLVKQASSDGIQAWSDMRKKEFVGTFEQRTQSAKWILARTAEIIINRAENRKFISRKHTSPLQSNAKLNANQYRDREETTRYGNRYTDYVYKSGGRALEDLEEIASDRAETILRELPPLKDAVRIISPETAQMIERRDEIVIEGQELQKKLEPLSSSIDMDELPETTTIKEFKRLVKERDDKRKVIFKKLNELGEEGQELEDKINKKLYAGLPGLTEAVIKTVTDHLERITAFDTMNRRVSEKVMFGDSDAAMSILTTFEKDEVEVSDNIKSEFANAMTKLRLSAGARKEDKKALKSAKTSKKGAGEEE